MSSEENSVESNSEDVEQPTAEETVDELSVLKLELEDMKDKFAKLEKLIIPLLIKLAKSPEAYIHWPNRAQVIEAQVKKIIEITRGK